MVHGGSKVFWGRGGAHGVSANEHGVAFWGDGNLLKLESDDCTTLYVQY